MRVPGLRVLSAVFAFSFLCSLLAPCLCAVVVSGPEESHCDGKAQPPESELRAGSHACVCPCMRAAGATPARLEATPSLRVGPLDTASLPAGGALAAATPHHRLPGRPPAPPPPSAATVRRI